MLFARILLVNTRASGNANVALDRERDSRKFNLKLSNEDNNPYQRLLALINPAATHLEIFRSRVGEAMLIILQPYKKGRTTVMAVTPLEILLVTYLALHQTPARLISFCKAKHWTTPSRWTDPDRPPGMSRGMNVRTGIVIYPDAPPTGERNMARFSWS